MATADQLVMRKRVHKHLLDHPEEHQQSLLAAKNFCGTARCIAGTALHFAGMLEFLRENEGAATVRDDLVRDYFDNNLDDEWGSSPFVYYGAQLMGLDSDQAGALFFEFNNARSMQILEHLCEETPDA